MAKIETAPKDTYQIRLVNSISSELFQFIELLDKGDLARAQALLDKTLAKKNDFEAYYASGMLLHKQGRTAEAIDALYKMAELAPGYTEGCFNLGVMLEQAGRFDEALRVYHFVLEIAPNNFQALFNLAHIFQIAGKLREAEHYYRMFLKQTPYHSGANTNLGSVLINQKRFDEALPYCEKAVMLALDNVDARNNCGIVYSQRGDLAKAEKFFMQALKIKPDYEPAKRNLELVKKQQLNPALTPAKSRLSDIIKRAQAELAAGEFATAEQSFREALLIRPDAVEALLGMGSALAALSRFEEAQSMIKRALLGDKGNVDAHIALGALYARQGKPDEAIEQCQKALALRANSFEAWHQLFLLQQEAGRNKKAREAYMRALHISPDKLLAIYPDDLEALAQLVISNQRLCLWDNAVRDEQRLFELADNPSVDKRLAYEGFLLAALMATNSSPAQQRRHAEECSRVNYGAASKPYDAKRSLPMDGRKGNKIRVGYLSCDFYEHATAYLLFGLFEQHDRNAFEIYVYSYGKDDKSTARKRIETAADRFIAMDGMSDKQAAEQIERGGIDILVDLKGYTGGHRLGIMALRPAPIQLHYLGNPGTIGAPFIDYFLADKVAAPRPEHFSEKLVYLPGSYQINDDKRSVSPNVPSRVECGLPEQGFVFGSFNQNYKITPAIFDVWMRLLQAVPGSVLWVYANNEAARDNLRAEAVRRGVDAARIIFAPHKPLAEHLARFAHMDLFLDTFPVNAHTTASDALWCGVPLVTIAGETFTSRVASSLLSAVGAPELITQNLAQYEALALKLAQNPESLNALRDKLKTAKSSLLFDTKSSTRAIEKAYLEMIERHKTDRMQESFEVKG